jgi:hydroxymethylpyrimidine/phosphomethylpyrimidine kinase
MPTHPPVVLCLSGHDPTGGAGVQADIETLRAKGCHPATLITALTAQDTRNVQAVYPQDPAVFLKQARVLLADLPVAAIKIGLLGSAGIAQAVAEVIYEAGPVPVVLDPILAAGGGRTLAGELLREILITRLFPLTTVLTPNTPEAERLTGEREPAACASRLLALGCENVLLTGTHEERPDVVNRWYRAGGVVESYWSRLPGTYHGSGCTLASAVAGGLAMGLPMADAVASALRYTWDTLYAGYAVGHGQQLPRR